MRMASSTARSPDFGSFAAAARAVASGGRAAGDGAGAIGFEPAGANETAGADTVAGDKPGEAEVTAGGAGGAGGGEPRGVRDADRDVC